MTIKSKALEINLASTQVDVVIDEKYAVLQDVFSRFFGISEGLITFLTELSHPYRNWRFIVEEARKFTLDHFHILKQHDKGCEAAELFSEIFFKAAERTSEEDVRVEAVDNLLLYLRKMIHDAGPVIEKFIPVFEETFRRIGELPEEQAFLFVKSYYSLKKLSLLLMNVPNPPENFPFCSLNRMLEDYFRRSFQYWLQVEDPYRWFKEELAESGDMAGLANVFEKITHEGIQKDLARLDEVCREHSLQGGAFTSAILELPGYNDIADAYREIPQRLWAAGEEDSHGNYWKVVFLFHIMNVSGLSTIHEETLRDINRTLRWLIDNESSENIQRLINKTFSILKDRQAEYPTTVLNCVLNMGKGVYRTEDVELTGAFIDSVVDLGFQLPMVGGVSDDWQIKVNAAHIQNVQTWMEIIQLNPRRSTRLLSHLIIYLSLCGVFIKDTDLFPRNISHFLNSDLAPVYNLAKQLARLFPAYFNDIGAEGKLRDISTQVDELTHRRDVLIHFLRKQSHVESSNLIIRFMEATLAFWKTGDKSVLEPFVPPLLFRQIDETGEFIDGVYRAMTHLKESGIRLPQGLLTTADDRLAVLVQSAEGVSETDRRRVTLLVEFYKLLNQKYNLEFTEISRHVEQLKAEGFPDLHKVEEAISEPEPKRRIAKLMDVLEYLKKIILSGETFEIRENIYKKRHFTVDIPSMYGSYHERKFDALGLAFRIESLLNVLFEELISDIDLSLITKATFYQIFARLRLFVRALKIDGISSQEMERQLELVQSALEVRGLTFTQFLDIFKGFALCIKNITNDYFSNIHELNLNQVLDRLSMDQILPKFLPKEDVPDAVRSKHRISEIFFRDRIAMSLGLQQLDLFLSRILNTLFHQSNRLPKDKLHQLLLYDPQRVITPIDRPEKMVSSLIYLGNKGYNLAQLKGFEFPVPPGFIITTEAFRWRVLINSYRPAEKNFKEQVVREMTALEEKTGRRFGDPTNPLLLSVRSGAAISQPGMMDTFLNVGITEEIAESIARGTGNDWFAWDNYRRFIQCYGMAFGLERDDFDAIISEFKRRWSIPLKREFTGAHMRKIALTYKRMVEGAGIDITEDPYEQLFLTIKLVFSSWDSAKARTFRKIMGISDDWGTAVTIQSMIFGNISGQSGSGVIFTHNPRWSGDALRIWGDFTLGNQGEDVVSGLVTTLPISLFQQERELRDTDITLETHFPAIYRALESWAGELVEKRGWTPQEMEFTFESPSPADLSLLQTRDMSIRERKRVLSFDPEKSDEAKILGNGIGVSGGAMSGRVVFNLEEIDAWRKKEPSTALILVRGDTVPDDIREIFAADGLLTARGGVTSHAAVVAHRLEKTCVVGCGNLVVDERGKACYFNQRRLNSGETISIDGQEGSVFRGRMPIAD